LQYLHRTEASAVIIHRIHRIAWPELVLDMIAAGIAALVSSQERTSPEFAIATAERP
jgi:hypothetical protein